MALGELAKNGPRALVLKEAPMQRVQPKWKQTGLVLVCERCSKERIPEEDPDKAREIRDFHLRDWLKRKLKDDGHWGKVRAVSTSCLDVCARRRVTVAIDFPGSDSPEVFVVDPVVEKDELYRTIVDRLGRDGVDAGNSG